VVPGRETATVEVGDRDETPFEVESSQDLPKETPPPDPQALPVLAIIPSVPAWRQEVSPAKLPAESEPLNNPLPATDNCVYGDEVPIPTFPFASMMKAVEVAEAVEVESMKSGVD